MRPRTLRTTIAVGAVCALTGAAVSGIATSTAADSTKTTADAGKAQLAQSSRATPGKNGNRGEHQGRGDRGMGGHRGGKGGGKGGGGIHSERVIADPDGSGFVTSTTDSGTLTAIDGSKLTIKEGTAKETFDTVTVTAAGTVTVKRNGEDAKLADLKVGDHVRVMANGTDTRVQATTAAFEKTRAAERAERRGSDADGDESGDSKRRAAPSWPTL